MQKEAGMPQIYFLSLVPSSTSTRESVRDPKSGKSGRAMRTQMTHVISCLHGDMAKIIQPS